MRCFGHTFADRTRRPDTAGRHARVLRVLGNVRLLHSAAGKGQMWLVGLLLRLGAQANSKGFLGSTPLMVACGVGHVDLVKVLLQHMEGQGLEEQDEKGYTALYWAVDHGHEEVVTLLLSSGAQANSKTQRGTTPVMLACIRGQLGMVKVFLQHMEGQGLEERNENGFTALRYAAIGGHAEVAAMLLSHGVDASSKDQDGTTPLMSACSMGHVDLVKVLLQHMEGQGLEEQDEKGYTALYWAVDKGREEVVTLLLSSGAQANSKTQRGTTPVMLACILGQLGMVKVFLQHMEGQGLEEQDENGNTALYCAAVQGHKEVVAMLLSHGVDANSKAQNGTTPLMSACISGHVGVVMVFLQHVKGQGLEECDNEGWTALHWAVDHGHEEVVALLLSSGAQANSKTQDGWTPLMLACTLGHVGVGQILLQHLGGQGLEEQNESGLTALHCAAGYGREEMVAILLNEGAQASRRMHDGRTPLMLACKEGHVGGVQTLVQHMGPQGLAEQDANGWTAPLFAAFYGHTEVVALLLGCGGVDFLAAHGALSLLLACGEKRMGVVRLLLQHNGRILLQRVGKWRTVLHMACSEGFAVEVVKALLLAGADTTITDDDGATPRTLAEAQGHTQLVALLDWWETELERPHLLHRARCLQEQCVKPQAAAAPTVPAYLKARVRGGVRLALPRVKVVARQQEQQGSVGDTVASAAPDADDRGQREEERHAVLGYVLEELIEQLFIELMGGFHAERRSQADAAVM